MSRMFESAYANLLDEYVEYRKNSGIRNIIAECTVYRKLDRFIINEGIPGEHKQPDLAVFWIHGNDHQGIARVAFVVVHAFIAYQQEINPAVFFRGAFRHRKRSHEANGQHQSRQFDQYPHHARSVDARSLHSHGPPLLLICRYGITVLVIPVGDDQSAIHSVVAVPARHAFRIVGQFVVPIKVTLGEMLAPAAFCIRKSEGRSWNSPKHLSGSASSSGVGVARSCPSMS